MSKKENITSYLLSLWQKEDLVRALGDKPIDNQELSELREMMHREGVWKQGHVSIANVTLEQIEDIHRELLEAEATYRAAFIQLQPQVNILKSKSADPTQSDIQMMFVFLYNLMLLKLQNRQISDSTSLTALQVSRLMDYLSRYYSAQ